VARGTLKSKTQLDAVFEAAKVTPLKLEPKAWTDLTVLEAVPHGAKVKRGETLVKLDTQKLQEQIDDLEQERPLAALALELAQTELENLRETTPQKLEAARRSRRLAEEDYNYFVQTNRAQREKSTKFNVKSSQERLDYALEELNQLEKMYKADDLTEETEEIILRRQKFTVESARFALEANRLVSERELKVSLPREFESLKNQKRDQEFALALAEETLPRTLKKKTLDVEKLKRDQKKPEKRLADLKSDLAHLHIRAPMDGLVYYGACENGKWTTGGTVARKLVPNGKLSANEVFMTVVSPDKLVLKTVVPEGELSRVSVGARAQAALTSFPDTKIKAKVEELGFVPMPGGGFEATLSLELDKSLHVVPGMTCKVSFGEKANALLVPKDAVFTEDDRKFVYLAKSNGGSEKRAVKAGDSDDKMVEILDGADEGDKILLKKPE